MNQEKFVARTRKRSEIDYYDAIWVPNERCRGKFAVKFITGPHKGEKYEAINVARAK